MVKKLSNFSLICLALSTLFYVTWEPKKGLFAWFEKKIEIIDLQLCPDCFQYGKELVQMLDGVLSTTFPILRDFIRFLLKNVRYILGQVSCYPKSN